MKNLISIFLLLLLFSCSQRYVQNIVYEPSQTDEVFSFFSNGVPIGSFSTKDEFFLFSVDKTNLLDNTYLRVWLLYENKTNSPFLLEPYDVITLEAEKDGEFLSEYFAESPSYILSKIDQQEATTMILKAIGGALEAMTVRSTTITSNSGTVYTLNDKNEKIKSVRLQNQSELQNTSNWYKIFRNSISNGVLRKNTVFPNQSVNGYLYFPISLTTTVNVNGGRNFGNNYNYETTVDINKLFFSLIIKTKDKNKRITLIPTAIW